MIPTALLDQMGAAQWRWVLAHELAHVRRRDYMVRWLEWLACVCFWWNPVVWWARHNLRANEEICCDALVIGSLKPKRDSYAVSLLAAIECLTRPALRPPVMASEINSGGDLERRFKMIVSGNPNRKTSRWLMACVLLCAIVVLPFGLAYAQDYDAVARRLETAVKEGEIAQEHADAMMSTLRRMGERKSAKDSKSEYETVIAEIQAAVEAGKITEEQGKARLEGYKQMIAQQKARQEELIAEYKAFAPRSNGG